MISLHTINLFILAALFLFLLFASYLCALLPSAPALWSPRPISVMVTKPAPAFSAQALVGEEFKQVSLADYKVCVIIICV